MEFGTSCCSLNQVVRYQTFGVSMCLRTSLSRHACEIATIQAEVLKKFAETLNSSRGQPRR